MKLNNLTYFFIFFLLPFILIIQTGLHSDDYSAIEISKNTSFLDFLNPSIYSKGQTLFGIFNYYFFYWMYEIFDRNYDYAYDISKIIIHSFSCYLFYKFSTSYLSKNNSILFTIFFIFSPLHDSTTYWYMTSAYIFTACIILYCHYLIRIDYLFVGFTLLLFSAFFSYSSPPYIFGASVIFLIEKKYKKFLIFLIPGLIYIFLYFLYSIYFPQYENRINDDWNLIFLIQNFILQILSSFDALFGPSSILKYYFSILQNNFFTVILSLIFIFIFLRSNFLTKTKFSKSLFIGLLTIYILSLMMFSTTGLYLQSPFNLGNRTLIYGTIFLSYIFIIICNFKKIKLTLIIIFVFSIFGLSQHWKNINLKQKIIIDNINNFSFELVNSKDTLLVEENLYFNLGPFSHIEFFTAPWVLESIFKNTNKEIPNISALKKHLDIKKDYILDIKNEKKIKLINDIYIYNTEKNNLIKIEKKEIHSYIDNQKIDKRHWIQYIKANFIKDIIVKLSPRLYIYFNEE